MLKYPTSLLEYVVFPYCNFQDFFKLSCTCQFIRKLLESRPTCWRESLNSLLVDNNGLSSIQQQQKYTWSWSLIQHVSKLVAFRGCTNCGFPKTSKINWDFLIRWCNDCLKFAGISESTLKMYEYRCPSDVFIASTIVKMWNKTDTRFYFIYHLLKYQHVAPICDDLRLRLDHNLRMLEHFKLQQMQNKKQERWVNALLSKRCKKRKYWELVVSPQLNDLPENPHTTDSIETWKEQLTDDYCLIQVLLKESNEQMKRIRQLKIKKIRERQQQRERDKLLASMFQWKQSVYVKKFSFH